MNHRDTETQRINKGLKSQLRNLKLSLPLCLCVSVVQKLRSASRPVTLLLLTFILTNHSTQLIYAAEPAAPQQTFSARDEAFLEDLERRMFRYFWEQADPHTGLVPDRARMDGSPLDENHRDVASIASTGFGLTALCIAAQRKWIGHGEAKERVRATLRFFAERAEQFHGWFFHWLGTKKAARLTASAVSSIHTALLVAGVLSARQKFRDDAEIVRLATLIYERVDFPWMLNGHAT